MEKRNDGGQAFPTACEVGHVDGMTLRQWYAGMALQGWVAALTSDEVDSYDNEPVAFAEHQRAVAKACFGYADALIAEDNEAPR